MDPSWVIGSTHVIPFLTMGPHGVPPPSTDPQVTRAIAEGDTIGREVEDNAKAPVIEKTPCFLGG